MSNNELKAYNKETKNSKYDFLNKTIPILNEDEKVSCEGPLSDYECFIALKDMQNNKSPGSDGLTTEFYKIFWKYIKSHLINSMNYSFQTGELNLLQKQSIITLLPKPNKDIHQLENWRPISLINVDYKIATKTIANRILKKLHTIINPS